MDHLLSEIGRPVQDDLREVRETIGQCISRQPCEMRESLGYYFSAGGKCMRPLLALLCARAAAGGALAPERARETVLFAAAVEFVHTASLVHDDIMDGDLLRRDMKALHAKYGKACAVLVGDVLQITGLDLLTRIGDRSVVGMMAGTIRAMCYGQMLDIRKTGRTAAEYARMIRCKTGSLMATACAGGALLSGAALPGRGVEDVARFGLHAGILYQMVDDRLDGDAGVRLEPGAIGCAALRSRTYLRVFRDSPYRRKLDDFVEYILRLLPARAAASSLSADG